MNDTTTRDKLKERAAAARREADLIGRLESVLDLGFTIEELREAVMLYDRTSGALAPSVAKVIPKLSESSATQTHRGIERQRRPPAYKERVCAYCGEKFLAMKANAIMCPKQECHAKRKQALGQQRQIAEAAVAQALRDGTAQDYLEHVDAPARARAAHLILQAKDRGRVLVPGDALRAAISIRKSERAS